MFVFSWKGLSLSVNERRKIPIRNIIKTFSSGKPEKMVQKCLSDLGLAGDKVSDGGYYGSTVSMSLACRVRAVTCLALLLL